MTYSTEPEVRKESGDPHISDVTAEDILAEIAAADTIIRNSTQHDWTDTDASWGLAKKVSKLLASSFVMDKYDDPKGEADKNFEKGMMLLQLLISEDEQSGDVNIKVTEYQTWPKNPNAKVGRGRLGLADIDSPEGIDPDELYQALF